MNAILREHSREGKHTRLVSTKQNSVLFRIFWCGTDGSPSNKLEVKWTLMSETCHAWGSIIEPGSFFSNGHTATGQWSLYHVEEQNQRLNKILWWGFTWIDLLSPHFANGITSNMIHQRSALDILFCWSHLPPLIEEADHRADHLTTKSPQNRTKVTACLRTIPTINGFIIVPKHTIRFIHIWHALPYFCIHLHCCWKMLYE